ncbi:MAG: hypothetical protein RDU20_08360 [Desulfomonilaceae bacterium]|nr:hypothetical protein [Desulfomonilaceae bacterium]
MNDAVIVSAVRMPVGKRNGSLSRIRAAEAAIGAAEGTAVPRM